MRSALLIYNPTAGRYPAGRFIRDAEICLQEAGWQTQLEVVVHVDDLRLLAKRAIRENHDAVFVIGGDGSVGTVGATLAGSETALGVLPAGTANVWGKELGLQGMDWIHPYAMRDAATRLANPEYHRVDIGEINNRRFLLWGSVGLDAVTVGRVEPRTRWEKIFPIPYYAMAVLMAAIGWKGIQLDIDISERQLSGRFVLAIAANIPSYGGGLIDLSPTARINDGLLDFWFFEGDNIQDVLKNIFRLLLGWHVNSSDVIHVQSASAVFESNKHLPVLLDGESVILDPPLVYRTHRKALKVLLPSGVTSKMLSSKETIQMEQG